MKYQSFQWSKHPSGIPWMRCGFCEKRINRQGKVTKLDKEKVYGFSDPNPTVITHEATYRCECGRSKIIVEGTMEEMELVGCFGVKVNG